MNNESTRLTLKLVILGDAQVGKTSLVHKYMGKKFSKRYQKTFGADISFKHIEFLDRNNITHQLSFSIWDIYGEATFEEMKKQFLIGTQAIIFMYDVVNRDSFNHVSNWFKIVNESIKLKAIPIILIGNKIDLRSDLNSSLSQDEGKSLFDKILKEYNLNTDYYYFLETSALDGTNIDKVFTRISEIIIEKILKK